MKRMGLTSPTLTMHTVELLPLERNTQHTWRSRTQRAQWDFLRRQEKPVPVSVSPEAPSLFGDEQRAAAARRKALRGVAGHVLPAPPAAL